MKRLVLGALLIVLAAAPAVHAHPLSKHQKPVAAPLLHEIGWYRGNTQDMRAEMGKSRWPVAHAERGTESASFRTWIRDLWRSRYEQVLPVYKRWERYFASWEVQERNWHRALHAAAARFHVSFSWLHACNHGEGDHDRYADNPHSDATGTMQFMPGTFSSNAPSAFRAAGVPRRYMSIYSFVGQAYTAAWMFSRGMSSHWVGAGC